MPPRTNYETSPSPMDRIQRRLGAGLTPQSITVTQRAADEGRMALWADLLDEVRQGDPHLHGDLQKRELSVAGADYELRLPTGATKRAGATALRLCQDAIEAIAPPAGSLAVSFRGAMQNLLTANWHGRAAVEMVYSRDGRYTIPTEAYPIHARRLSWSNDLDWRLYLYDETTGDTRFSRFPGVPFSDRAMFPAGKILLHTPRLFGTYPTREGLGRALDGAHEVACGHAVRRCGLVGCRTHVALARSRCPARCPGTQRGRCRPSTATPPPTPRACARPCRTTRRCT